eukprot:12430833-Karenia_brevis.AAC.1
MMRVEVGGCMLGVRVAGWGLVVGGATSGLLQFANGTSGLLLDALVNSSQMQLNDRQPTYPHPIPHQHHHHNHHHRHHHH